MDKNRTPRRPMRGPSERKLIQLYSALLYNAHLRGFAVGDIYQGSAKYACVPGLNCYSCPGAVGACPLGALQNALASSGHRAGWYVLGIFLLFGTLLGRTVCGWLCPFGLIQELLHRIPTFKIKKSRATRLLSWTKYVLLVVFAIAVPLWYGLARGLPMPGFCKLICPAGTLEGAVGLLSHPSNDGLFAMLGPFFTSKFVILCVILLACVFCYRSFCRFLCPLGAIYSLFNRFCLVGVKVDKERCSGCGSCVRHCGMDVRRVGDHECIHCAKCMEVCTQKAISLKAGRATLKAPAGSFGAEEQKKRKRLGRAAWGAALALLCLPLLWFNFLDPAVRTDGTEPAAVHSVEGTPISSEVGMQLEDFTLPCFDGSEFHLAETRGKPTFINLWATYCGPCVEELPYFDTLSREHGEDIAVLAVHSSFATDDPAAFLAGKGYTFLCAVDTAADTVWHVADASSALPQTLVLDREGVVIYNRKGSVTPAMLEALYAQAARGDPGQAVPEGAPAESGESYLVLVTDETGNPVPDAVVQFCSDELCITAKTDAEGAARFEREAGAYTVHVLKVPTGYAADETEYPAPAAPGTVSIILRAEADA